MMKTKKKIMAAAFSALIISQSSFAGIPTIDVVSNVNDMIAQVQNLAQFVQQVEQLKNQLDQAKKQFDSLNGARGMAMLLNDPTARQYLPKDAGEIYQLASGSYSGSHGSLSSSVKALKDAARLLKSEDVNDVELGKTLDSQQNMLATMQASSEAAYNAAGDRFDKLQELIDNVDLANDPKAAMDLQNRIQAEQVMMQNETAKLGMLKNLQEIQQKQLVQRGIEQTASFGQAGNPVIFTSY